jgi:hypothetical protein
METVMIAICTIWSEDFATGIGQKRWYLLYKQAAKALGATHVLWIEDQETVPENADQEIVREVHSSLADVRTAHPGATFVFLDAAEGSADLADFEHPAGDTVYVVGTDSAGLGETLVPEEGEAVLKISASIELWSHMALAITLYDRQTKAAA